LVIGFLSLICEEGMRRRTLLLVLIAFCGGSSTFAGDWVVNYPSGGTFSTAVSFTATGTFDNDTSSTCKIDIQKDQGGGNWITVRGIDVADTMMGSSWEEPFGTLMPGVYKVRIFNTAGDYKAEGAPFTVQVPWP
jgi:hypothetical protein